MNADSRYSAVYFQKSGCSTLSLVLSQCRGAAAVQRRQEALIYHQVCVCAEHLIFRTKRDWTWTSIISASRHDREEVKKKENHENSTRITMSYFPSPCDHSNWVKTQPQRRRFYAWLECQQISVDLLSEEWIMHRMPPLRIDSRAGKRRNKGRQDQIARRRPEVSILYHAARRRTINSTLLRWSLQVWTRLV